MSREKDNELYEKIETLCQRLDAYTTKIITVKNQVKTTAYIKKIHILLEMISSKENVQVFNKRTIKDKEQMTKNIEEENVKQELKENKYNPYSEEFLYKDRLDRLNCNVEALLEELKNEDKLGYRNALVINEIKKNVEQKEKEELRKQMLALSKNKTTTSGLLDRIIKMMLKIKEAFKGNSPKKYKKEEI